MAVQSNSFTWIELNNFVTLVTSNVETSVNTSLKVSTEFLVTKAKIRL